MSALGSISIYQNSVAQASQTTSVQNSGTPAGKEVGQLPVGSVFEGTVTDVKGDAVTLRLDNGQAMKARLDSGVNVRQGEPVMFEVKSNQGHQIMLRQVPINSSLNPTLQRALTAASLPLTAKNLELVNQMMKNQLPIDKNSLGNMARLMQNHPSASPETVVQMHKLGFSITEESVSQFEAYKNGEHSLVQRFSEIMDQLPKLLGQTEGGGKALVAMQEAILSALELGGEPEAEGQAAGLTEGSEVLAENPASQETAAADANANVTATAGQTEALLETVDEMEEQTAAKETSGQEASNRAETVPGAEGEPEAAQSAKGQVPSSAQQPVGASQPLSEFLPKGAVERLEQQLKELPGMEEDGRLFADGKLNRELTAKETLGFIQKNLAQLGGGEDANLKNLLQGKEYRSLLKQAVSEQWFLKPKQVEQEQSVKQLYERLERQTAKLEQLLAGTAKEMPALSKNVGQVRGNLDMMNQINQLYNYVQIPLKLSNQNAHSDLYVYTNKKKLMDKEGELSALLHLDLEHLGTTDVQIKMMGSSVTTNFFLADDEAFDLVERHVDELQERLKQKGFNCSIHLENRAQEIDFVEDFLEREAPVGSLQRYSFDVLT